MATTTESKQGISMVRNFLAAALVKVSDFERQPTPALKEELRANVAAALAAVQQLKIPVPP
jgi:hypothetical protein